MKIFFALIMIAFMLPGLGYSNEAPPERGQGPGRPEIEGFREYQQQEQTTREENRAKMLQLEAQAASLKVEMLKAKDDAAKKEVWEKIKPLCEQKFALMEEMAKHEIEAAKQFVTFAQKRVEMAEKRLAEVQAKKEEMVNAPPMGEGPGGGPGSAAEPPAGPDQI